MVMARSRDEASSRVARGQGGQGMRRPRQATSGRDGLVPLMPSPANWGKTNHIQWDRLCSGRRLVEGTVKRAVVLSVMKRSFLS